MAGQPVNPCYKKHIGSNEMIKRVGNCNTIYSFIFLTRELQVRDTRYNVLSLLYLLFFYFTSLGLFLGRASFLMYEN